jgi:hypothetical protein
MGSNSDLSSKVCTLLQNNAVKEIRALEQSLHIISNDTAMKDNWLHLKPLVWVPMFRQLLHVFTCVLLNMSINCCLKVFGL